LITEATYGAPGDIMPTRLETEEDLVRLVRETIRRRGKVLIPTLAVGRSQEIMLTLDRAINDGRIEEVPIFIEGMISEITAIHTAYPEYLSRSLKDKILKENLDPFRSEYFTTVKSPSERPEIIEGEPCVILATSGMLEGGPVLDYFRHLAPESENTIIFVSYQIEGTLGRKVQSGLKEVPMLDETGKMIVVKVEAQVEFLKGFSGHSDRRQILAYLRKISPKPRQVIVCHGERLKCLNMASTIKNLFGLNACSPANLESIRLK
jgi:hypothetical protein